MRNVDEYEVFKVSHAFTLEIYQISKRFPREEIYGLTTQIRRAAYSIPMNLKEGSVGTEPEFFKYVRIAYASKEEVDYQLLLARDLNYISKETWKDLSEKINSIGKMLYSILKRKGNKEKK